MIKRWKPIQNFKPSSSIRVLEGRQEVSLGDLPDLSQLQPGQAMSNVPCNAGSENIAWTGQERVVFQSGARVEELSPDGGLQITRPDGSKYLSKGKIEVNESGVSVSWPGIEPLSES